MKITPLRDRVLVRRVGEEETTKSGIIIPDSAKEKPQEGEVVAVGSGKILDDRTLSDLEFEIRRTQTGLVQGAGHGLHE